MTDDTPGDYPVSEQEESLIGDWEVFQKLKQDNERVEDHCAKLKVIEKFVAKLEKQASVHVAALRSFLENSKSMADTFREFYHWAGSDTFLTPMSDELCVQTNTTMQEVPRTMDKAYESSLRFMQHWLKEIARVRELHKVREAAKRKYIHYINKLQTLGEKPKKGVIISEKKQTQVKRNRLKLDEARKHYEKVTGLVWSTFDVCWDCQFTHLNPTFESFVSIELRAITVTQQSLTKVEEGLVDNLSASVSMHQQEVEAHAKLVDSDKVIEDDPEAQFRTMDTAEELVSSLRSVKVEYDPNDMLATVLDGDISEPIQKISDDQLCHQMPIIGATLAISPRPNASNALTKRAAAPCVAQCVAFLKECEIVPHGILADIETSDSLLRFFSAFEKIITSSEHLLGLDFKPPPGCFHPFQVTSPLKRFVVQHAFVSSSKPVLLAAFSEYEDNQDFNQLSTPQLRSARSLERTASTRPPSSTLIQVSSPDDPPIPPRPKSPMRPKHALKLESMELLLPPTAAPSDSKMRSPSTLDVVPRNSTRGSLNVAAPQEEKKEEKPLNRWEVLDQSCRLPDFIFKCDDMRTDEACLHLFRLMNQIWKSQNLMHKAEPVQAKVYKVQAISPTMGLAEYVPNCYPLSALSKQAAYNLTERQIERMVATSVAGYIAVFILGIRDRHSENILITEDATVFHIDFSHILGRGATIDTGPFAITPEFKMVLEEWYAWHAFVDLCVKAFLMIRAQSDVVAEFARLLLSPLFPDVNFSKFVKEKLMMDAKSPEEVCTQIRKLVLSAPKNYKTRLKNLVHGANSAISRTKNDFSTKSPPKPPPTRQDSEERLETAVIAQGRLLKKSPRVVGRYQDRHFELLPLVLRYRKKPGGSIKGEIELQNIDGIRVSEAAAGKESTDFEIDVKNILGKDGSQGRRTFVMRAASADEALFWTRAIKERMDKLYLEQNQTKGFDLSGRSY